MVTFNRPLCCSFPLFHSIPSIRALHKGKNFILILLLFASRSFEIHFQTLWWHLSNPQYLLIYITQLESNKKDRTRLRRLMKFFSGFCVARLSFRQITSLRAYLLIELWFIYFVLYTKCVWIIAYRAHIAPSTILLFRGVFRRLINKWQICNVSSMVPLQKDFVV